jgi:hypothetical protein
MLYESELQDAHILCFSCARIYDMPADEAGELRCPECGFIVPHERYREFYRHAFYAARYGVQYREFYDQEDEATLKPSLVPLGELGTFIALAVASGVLGNASYDLAKVALKRILSQRELCKDQDNVTFAEEDIEKLISYLVDYEDGFSQLPERIRHEIAEEILGDAAGDNPAIAKRLAELLFENSPPSEANKRQAIILYRELARRASVRAKKKPNRPAWRFWQKARS